jgi:RND family efflux transporter MFP subunit
MFCLLRDIMIPQGSELDLNLAGFASRLLEVLELNPRARLTAQLVASRLPGTIATVYLLEEGIEGQFWSARATAGEGAEPDQIVPAEVGPLGSVFRDHEMVVLEGRSLVREDYAHLNVRRTVKSLACIPLLHNAALVASIEILSFEAILDRPLLRSLEAEIEIATQALLSALTYEEERHNSLTSITRLTQLYDLEKVFNSTLEMEELMPIIASKCREALSVQAMHLWMVKDQNELLLSSRDGVDPTVLERASQKTGEGIAAEVSDSGEPLLIDDPNDERLAKRNADSEEAAVFSVMATPLIIQGNEVGVLEAVNKLDGTPFDEDDLFFLNSIAETAAGALHNASLMHAERKVEILETLVKVSTEITSTLNLDRVLYAVVNLPGSVIPYERAAVAMEQRGKTQVKAISGMAQINPGDVEVDRLRAILQWASLVPQAFMVKQHGEEVDQERPETREKFLQYFTETGMRGFYALPLADEEGRLGILSFESSNPDFLSEAHLEMINILAAQATVALRNATLYKEVPFIGVLEPFLQKKQKFMAQGKRRRTLTLAAATGAVLFFAVFPVPLRVDGNAEVAAAHTAQIQSAVDGVVHQVFIREGQKVMRGDTLADLEDWPYRSALAEAQAKYETANSEMNRALASNDGSEAGIQRVQASYWAAEVERDRQRLAETHLRALFDGWITTPHVENMSGRHLAVGDTFAEIIDSSRATIDVGFDEQGIVLLRRGAAAAVKLDGYPTRIFRGTIDVISPKGDTAKDSRLFYARITVPNSDGRLRPGMQGRAKISAGWGPVGYVLFRRPAMWIYSQLWSLLGW